MELTNHCEGYLGIENRHVCMTCDVPWPCEVAALRTRLEAEQKVRLSYQNKSRMYDEVLVANENLQQRLAQVEQEKEALLADRSIKSNGARMLARFVLSRLPKKHTTHNDGELFNVATGLLGSDVPHTTPWLIQMMEVARRDKDELPQLLFRANEQLATAQARIGELEQSTNINNNKEPK